MPKTLLATFYPAFTVPLGCGARFLSGACVEAVAPPLAQFLDYITYDYMIDNVMLVLKATLNNPNVDVKDLIEQAHPLGKFKAATMRSICAFENTTKGYSELYQTVLVDTPIGKYFQQFLQEESDKMMQATGEVRNLLEEMPTTKLENSLRKLYLEDFFVFCQKVCKNRFFLIRFIECCIYFDEVFSEFESRISLNIQYSRKC